MRSHQQITSSISTSEESFLVTLAGFIAQGVAKGESAIIIATQKHLAALEQRLLNNGVDLATALVEHRYIALDAEIALASFMRNNWPGLMSSCLRTLSQD